MMTHRHLYKLDEETKKFVFSEAINFEVWIEENTLYCQSTCGDLRFYYHKYTDTNWLVKRGHEEFCPICLEECKNE